MTLDHYRAMGNKHLMAECGLRQDPMSIVLAERLTDSLKVNAELQQLVTLHKAAVDGAEMRLAAIHERLMSIVDLAS